MPAVHVKVVYRFYQPNGKKTTASHAKKTDISTSCVCSSRHDFTRSRFLYTI